MFGLNNSSGIPVMPALAEKLTENPQWFTEGGNGVEPSWPGADWFNSLQAELINIVLAADIELSPNDTNQLLSAILKLSINQLDQLLSGGGSFSMPYKVIAVDLPPFNGDLDAAISASNGYTTFLLGNRTYVSNLWSGGNRNTKTGIKLIGSGIPVVDHVNKKLTDYTGTIIRGSIQNSAKAFECYNLGIDLSDYTRLTHRSGIYEDAFVNYGFGDNAGIRYGNLVILESDVIDGDAQTYTHCHLAEVGSGITVTGSLEIINGYHGYVVKCQDFDASSRQIAIYGQKGSSHIVKSDVNAKAKNIKMGHIKCGKSGYLTRAGRIQAHSLNYTDSVSYDSLTGSDNEGLLLPANNNTGYITQLRIGYAANVNSYGENYSITVPANAVDWSIGEHELVNVSGGISTENGCANVRIGDGCVKGSTVHGYNLAGDFVHGNLIANDNALFGVNRVSGDGLNINKITGVNNSAGLYNSIPSAIENLQNGWSQGNESNFRIDKYGREIKINGRLDKISAIAGTAATINLAYRPTIQHTILAHGIKSDASVIPLWCYVTTDGRLEVDGYELATGGYVDFCGSYFI